MNTDKQSNILTVMHDINVFLQQQFAGAIDFHDFISNLQVTVADLERTGTEVRCRYVAVAA